MERRNRSNHIVGPGEMDGLSKEGRAIVNLISVKIDGIRDTFQQLLDERDERIATLESEVSSLKGSLVKFEEQFDDNESLFRKNDIILSGNDIPLVASGEDCSKLACAAIKSKLKVNIKPADIAKAQRIGRPTATQRPDRRNILVKFYRDDMKNDLLIACRQSKPSDFYISENLIPKRSSILYNLRQAKKKYPSIVAGCSSRDMKIYAWIKPNDQNTSNARNSRMMINTLHKWRSFCREVLHVSPDSILNGSSLSNVSQGVS